MKKKPKKNRRALVKAKEKPTLTRPQAEKLRDAILASFHSAEKNLISAAIHLDSFLRGRGWMALGYKTQVEWREAECGFSEFYNLRHILRLLMAGVPPEQLERMKLSNVSHMVRYLPEKLWGQPEWQKAAVDMPVLAFEERVREKSNEVGMHVEELLRRGFLVPASLVKQWDLALLVAEAVDGAQNMEQRVTAIVSAYLDSDSPQAGLSKRQFYERMQLVQEQGTETEVSSDA